MPHVNGKVVCVFGAASDTIEPIYFDVAIRLGRLIVSYGYELIYGGSRFGLIGAVARQVQADGGRVTGVIPRLLDQKGITYRDATQIIVTSNMHDRKATLSDLASVFVVLPGGIGTLEEAFAVLTHRRLGFHSKPIVFVNTNGFYDFLLDAVTQLIRMGFAKPTYLNMILVADDPDEVFPLIGEAKAGATNGTRASNIDG